MELKELEMVKKDEAGKRILCIGKIHKGKRTMIFAFPRKVGNEDFPSICGKDKDAIVRNFGDATHLRLWEADLI